MSWGWDSNGHPYRTYQLFLPVWGQALTRQWSRSNKSASSVLFRLHYCVGYEGKLWLKRCSLSPSRRRPPQTVGNKADSIFGINLSIFRLWMSRIFSLAADKPKIARLQWGWKVWITRKRRKPRKSGLRRHFLAPPARIELTTNP